MTEMAKGVTFCFLTLLLILTSVSAIQTLNRMRDLKKIFAGGSVPEHSAVLLYWFAHSVIIEGDDQIRLTFNPGNGDYGSHRYYNLENLLDRLPRGQQYYTIGNINQPTSVRLDRYVLDPPADIEAGNMGRIIIRVRGTMIEEVYLTQHSHNLGRSYDPNYTYHITTNLLRQIQEFSMGDNYQTLVRLQGRYRSNADVDNISDLLGELACLGLFLCIVLNQQLSFQEQIRRPENRNNRESTEVEQRNLLMFPVPQNVPVSQDVPMFRNVRMSRNDECCTTRCKCTLAMVIVLLIIIAVVIYLMVKIKKQN